VLSRDLLLDIVGLQVDREAFEALDVKGERCGIEELHLGFCCVAVVCRLWGSRRVDEMVRYQLYTSGSFLG
jgi:hypothetical protein